MSLDAINAILEKRTGSPQTTVTDFSRFEPGAISFGRLPEKKSPAEETRESLISDLRGMTSQEQTTDMERAGRLFVRGVNRVTGGLASLPEALIGTVKITGSGFEYLSPEEAARQRELGFEGGGLGLPGGTEEAPRNFFERGMEVSGETAAVGPLFSRALAMVPHNTRTTLLAKAQNFARGVGTQFMSARVGTTAAEAGAGFVAGGAGELAAERFPNSPAARFVGEMVGGTTAPLIVPGRYAYQGAQWLRRRVEPYTVAGGSRRGIRRIQRAATELAEVDPVRGLRQETTIDPQTGEPVLTPMARTGDRGPLSLERDVANELQELGHLDERMARANEVLQQAMKAEAGQGDPLAAKEYLVSLFGTRLQIAGVRIERQLKEMGDNISLDDANRTFDTEWRKVLDDVARWEAELYNAIPTDFRAPTGPAREAFQRIQRKMTETGEKNIPSDARRFLKPTMKTAKGAVKRNPNYLGDTATVGQLRNLYQNLRESARRARKAGSYTLARNADDLADSITDSLAKTYGAPEMREAVDLAVGFSRDVNAVVQNFELGRVGGRSVTPERRPFRPEEIGNQTIGLRGNAGKAAYEDIVTVIRRSKEVGSSVDEKATRDAAMQYIRSKFIEENVEGDHINLKSATDFLKRHSQLLDALPEARKEIRKLIRLGQERVATELSEKEIPFATAIRDETGKFVSPRVAKAAMVVRKDPNKFFQEQLNGRPTEVRKNMDALVSTLNLDDTGVAMQGMRAAWIDYIMTGAQRQVQDVTGRPMMSGTQMTKLLQTRQAQEITRKLFPDPQQRRRLRTVVRDFRKLELQREARLSAEGVLGDQPNTLLNTAMRFLGAGVVRRTVDNAAIQQTQAGANVFSELLRHGVRDPAKRFIISAVADEGVFRTAVTARAGPDGTLPPKARKKLAAWAASLLLEHGMQIRPEDERREPEEPTISPETGRRPGPAPVFSGP